MLCEYERIGESDFLRAWEMDMLSLPIPANTEIRKIFTGVKKDVAYAVLMNPMHHGSVLYYKWSDFLGSNINGIALNKFRAESFLLEGDLSLPLQIFDLLDDEYVYACCLSDMHDECDFWKVRDKSFLCLKDSNSPLITEAFPVKYRYDFFYLAGSSGNWKILLFDDEPFVFWVGRKQFIRNLSALNSDVMLEVDCDWILFPRVKKRRAGF